MHFWTASHFIETYHQRYLGSICDIFNYIFGIVEILAPVFVHVVPRWNEKKIKEMSLESTDANFRQRAGRLDKWKELARQAAAKQSCDVVMPDSLQWLAFDTFTEPVREIKMKKIDEITDECNSGVWIFRVCFFRCFWNALDTSWDFLQGNDIA